MVEMTDKAKSTVVGGGGGGPPGIGSGGGGGGGARLLAMASVFLYCVDCVKCEGAEI